MPPQINSILAIGAVALHYSSGISQRRNVTRQAAALYTYRQARTVKMRSYAEAPRDAFTNVTRNGA